MLSTRQLEFGWRPDIPDCRDRLAYSLPFCGATQESVDLREEGFACPWPICPGVNATCAYSVLYSCLWQARKWTGVAIDSSPSFLYRLTKKVSGGGGRQGFGLRATLKTLVRFGSPPERMWSVNKAKWFNSTPKHPQLFGYLRPFQDLRYMRLDAWTYDRLTSLMAMRRWVAEGNPFVLGFSVPKLLITDRPPTIPLEFERGGTAGGSACLVLGYDDAHRLPQTICHPLVSEQFRDCGAFLIQTFWSGSEADNVAWLPYAFIETRFASDAWALSHLDWQFSSH